MLCSLSRITLIASTHRCFCTHRHSRLDLACRATQCRQRAQGLVQWCCAVLCSLRRIVWIASTHRCYCTHRHSWIGLACRATPVQAACSEPGTVVQCSALQSCMNCKNSKVVLYSQKQLVRLGLQSNTSAGSMLRAWYTAAVHCSAV